MIIAISKDPYDRQTVNDFMLWSVKIEWYCNVQKNLLLRRFDLFCLYYGVLSFIRRSTTSEMFYHIKNVQFE